MIKPIAIHLPQFHPITENDQWWGKGFTEWTNVSKAKPLFAGHYQPHLPADLGFYDLRLEEARLAQADLAKHYGIQGFCYYHYWFNGKRLLNRPLDDMIASKEPDFPFMLCWANENWTRRWDGLDQQILIKQEYSERDDRNHIRFLCENFFMDPRYLKVKGKPFFLIYRPSLFPNVRKTIDIWRDEAVRLGVGELFLGYVQSFGVKHDPKQLGFDCAIEFHPDFHSHGKKVPTPVHHKLLMKLRMKDSPFAWNNIVSYKSYVEAVMDIPIAQRVFPGITPMWDNSARKKKEAYIFYDSTPELYEEWLNRIYEKYSKVPFDDKFVFINAWNEWAEGNHLEPCQKWGRSYLEATKRVVEKYNGRA
jgi:lipopolysaccharide biosynthesis protein